jgi:hypothetical protein
MQNNVIIITNCGAEDCDRELLVGSYSVHPENLNTEHFDHMVRERDYMLAEEAFKDSLGHDDLMYYEDEEQGYTEHQGTFYIDQHYVIWYEEGGISIRHYYGDVQECWTKPTQVNCDNYNQED